MLTGANMIASKSSETIKASGANYLEQKIIKGRYVSIEEFQQLQKLVQKLQQEISELKNKP